MMKCILCPADLKERADIALREAVQIAHQLSAGITILNVHSAFLDTDERRMLPVNVDRRKGKYRRIAFESNAEMKAAIDRLHIEDIEIDYLLRGGKPAETIVAVAADENIDMIVMCTDDRDNEGDFTTGTITERMINNAPYSVLVVPQPGWPSPRGAIPGSLSTSLTIGRW